MFTGKEGGLPYVVASTREASTAAAAQAVREGSGEGNGKGMARLARQGGFTMFSSNTICCHLPPV